MKIVIDTYGAIVRCTINGVLFNHVDKVSQVVALDAFRIIENEYKKK